MGVNKVIYYGEVLVDMSQVTVTPETLGKGVTALDAKGDLITGLHECEETEPKLQSKTVTPTTSLQTVNPDSGYDGLSKVTVNAMPTATQATPSITVSSGGLITAKSTQTAGYVASGTKQATKQLTTQAAKTITPTKSAQTAVASGRYTTGAVTVAAIPDTYIQPSGTLDATANGTYDVKNYASVNVNVPSSGSGSGGGSVGTCTLYLNCTLGFTTIQYSKPSENGEMEFAYEELQGALTATIQCIPNTIIELVHHKSDNIIMRQNIQTVGSISESDRNRFYFAVTAEVGGTARIIFSDEPMI